MPRAERLLDALLAGGVAVWTYWCGSSGLYLIDTSINYQQGWLIYRGWRPFIDFTGPLLPGAGLLTALGYLLFGVTYLSSVRIGALVAGGLAFALMGDLRRVLPVGVSRLFAVVVAMSGIPVIGTLFYNHLSATLLAAMGIHLAVESALAQADGRMLDRRRMVWVYALGTAIGFLKLHAAAVPIAAALLLDAAAFFRHRGDAVVSLRRELVARFAFPALAVTALFAATARHLASAADQLFRVPRAAINPHAVDSMTGAVESAASEPTLTIVFGAIWLTAHVLLSRRADARAQQGLLGPALAGFAVLLAQSLVLVVSLEARSGALPAIASVLPIGAVLVAVAVDRDAEKLRVALPAAIAVALGLLWFDVQYAGAGWRRSYQESPGRWIAPGDVGLTVRSDDPFFRGLDISVAQRNAIEIVRRLVARNPGMTFFFGSSLEMFYPAVRRMPPRPWPLWMHWDLSVRTSSEAELRARLAAAPPDIVVLASDRAWNDRELAPLLRSRYRLVRPVPYPRTFIGFWVRSDRLDAFRW